MADEVVTPAPAPTSAEENPNEGPGKGTVFFERARTVTETGNYEYAIELYIQGLFRDPNNLVEHEALRNVALHRKVKGGRPAGGFLGPKPFFKGRSKKELMLNAEWVLAHDPSSISVMIQVMKNALNGGHKEVVKWFGPILLLANKSQKFPKKELYLEVATFYEAVAEPAAALGALQYAIEMDPEDMNLTQWQKNLAADHTIIAGKYDTGGDFKESIKDKELTRELSEEENINKSEDYKQKQMAAAKADYESNPREHPLIMKYVKTLLTMEDESHEHEAIEVLERAFKATKTYRYKMTIGDIRIKRYRGHMRMLREANQDGSLDEDVRKVLAEQIAFELEEFRERVQNYPTDMNFTYEYGRRLYATRNYDEAIAVLQQAQNSPRHRADAMHMLGRAFVERGMIHEAVETLRNAVQAYEYAETGDSKTKEYHYWLARALESQGQGEDALAIYSKISLWDISFRDARTRLEAIRGKAAPGGNKV